MLWMFLFDTAASTSRLIATRRSAAQSASLFSSALHASAFWKGSVGGSTQFPAPRAAAWRRRRAEAGGSSPQHELAPAATSSR